MPRDTKQKRAMALALKEIEECRKPHSYHLAIGYNDCLNKFPEEIRELTSLCSLFVVSTGIKVLPDWIGELVNLNLLVLSGNKKLNKLPLSIANLKKLTCLNICNTGIKEVPQCIIDLPLVRIETGEYDSSGEFTLELYFYDMSSQSQPRCSVNLENVKCEDIFQKIKEAKPDFPHPKMLIDQYIEDMKKQKLNETRKYLVTQSEWRKVKRLYRLISTKTK